jgi:hypothetical protein
VGGAILGAEDLTVVEDDGTHRDRVHITGHTSQRTAHGVSSAG